MSYVVAMADNDCYYISMICLAAREDSALDWARSPELPSYLPNEDFKKRHTCDPRDEEWWFLANSCECVYVCV